MPNIGCAHKGEVKGSTVDEAEDVAVSVIL
jgi:hypothetical protein